MKINIDLDVLTKKTNAIASVVPVKTTMPILSNLLITAEKNGINFSATDLDISVTSKIEADVSEEGRVAIPAKKFTEIVKSLSGKSVTLSSEGEKLNIACGKSEFVVNGRNPDDFPKLPKQESKTSFSIETELLEKIVQKTVYAVSTDLTRASLCGVLWEVDRRGITLVSTDGHRLSKVEVEMDLKDVAKVEAIVPPKALSTIGHYTEGHEKVDVGIGDNSISFDVGESSIYSRLLEGPFPSYKKVIPSSNEKELVVSAKSLADATKRVSILSDALTHQVIFSLDKNKLTLHIATQELGEAREELEASYSEDKMDIGYNASYVMDILRTMDSEDISFMLDRPDNAGIVLPVEQSGAIKHMCIIMPLRIS